MPLDPSDHAGRRSWSLLGPAKSRLPEGTEKATGPVVETPATAADLALRANRDTMLFVTGIIWVLASLAGLLSLAPHQARGTDVSLIVEENLGAFLAGAALLGLHRLVPARATEAVFHSYNVLAVAGISLGLAAAPTLASALAYLGPLTLALAFCKVRDIVLYAVLVSAGFAGAVALAHRPSWAVDDILACCYVIGVVTMLVWMRLRLERLAERDPLCGILNRAGLERRLRREVAVADRAAGALTLGVIDLDSFKETNDRLGHAAGDDMLRRLSSTWQALLAPGETLARLGGDEFVLVLPDSSTDAVLGLGERIVADTGAQVSLGLASRRPGEPWEHVLRRADLAMLRAKQAGGARVVHD